MSLKVLPVASIKVFLILLVCCQAVENIYSIEIASRKVSCPPWYFSGGENKCSFSHQLPQIVNQYGNTSELEIGFCITLTNSSLVVAQCPYIPTTHNVSQFHSIYQVLPQQLDQFNDIVCSIFNRKGFLCSECKDNYGLAAYRYYGLMCVKCSSSTLNWIGYILLLFIPPTIFFLFFLIIDVNIHSGKLTGFIYFAHTIITTSFFFPSLITLPQSLFGYWPMQILLALYGVWNLNFMQFMIPPFCISTSLTTLQLASLGYVSSVYPLVLCIITYYLIELHARGNWLFVRIWRPFQWFFIKLSRPSNIQSSVIHTFATFILLSYGKNLFVSFTLVQGYKLVELDTNTNTLKSLPPHSVDLGAPYFGATHAPYGALGLLGGVFTVILPLVLVSLYPTRVFSKLTRCCGLRRWHAMRTFLEVFVGSYKDGTNATESKRDYRFFAALYLIGRILNGVGWAKRGANHPLVQHYAWLVTAAPYILVAVAFALFKPHRKWSHNVVDALMFLLLAKICICFHIVFETEISEYTLKVMFLTLLIDLAIPQVVLFTYACIKLALWACSQDLKQLCSAWSRKGNTIEEILPQIPIPSESQPLLHN